MDINKYLPSLLLVEVTRTIGDLLVGCTGLGHAKLLLGGVET